MSRHHPPRPPGRVEPCCTGRGVHNPVQLRPSLHLTAEGDRLRLYWRQAPGAAPETGWRGDPDGWRTIQYQCPLCKRHLKRREDELVPIVIALGRQQGLAGNDNRPVVLDISAIERA